MPGLEVYKNTCLCFSTQKLYAIYVFNSVQSNSKRFLCTSVHFNVGRDVATFLGETFPGLWVWRGSPTAWPPRSPDLTPLDFFAWGFIKDVVYRRKVWDLADLRQRIIEAVELITPHMLINTWQRLEYRLDLSSYNRCPHWTVRSIKIFLSYSVHCWKHKLHKAFGYWNISMYLCIPLARTPCMHGCNILVNAGV